MESKGLGTNQTSVWDGQSSFKLDVTDCANAYRTQIAAQIAKYAVKPKLVGFLSNDDPAALAYSRVTANACEKDGIDFELRRVDKLELEEQLAQANQDPKVHGIMIYYPVFGSVPSVSGTSMARMVGAPETCPTCFSARRFCNALTCSNLSPCRIHESEFDLDRDSLIRDLIVPEKDVEGLCHLYRHSLYHNIRYADAEKTKKCLAPCTPVACVKILESLGVYSSSPLGTRLKGKVVTVINRSDIVGLPLAALLASEGAVVYSVDIDSIFVFREGKLSLTTETPESACRQSNVIVLGVPSKSYQLPPECVSDNTVVLNVSPFKALDQSALLKKIGVVWVPLVGKVTVAMLERNLIRLYQSYHLQPEN